MGQGVSKFLQKTFLKEEKEPELPNPKKYLKKFPHWLQIGILLLNIMVNVLFCYGFALSFIKKINGNSASLYPANEVDILVCFPNLKEDWDKWFALVFYELSDLLDFISSLSYLNTLTCNWKMWFTYEKHCSPIYTIIAGLQSVWIQKASLNCDDSDSTDIIFSFASVSAGIQTVTIIACILLRFVESRFFYFGKSCQGWLKEFLKVVCTLLHLASMGSSLYIWFSTIVSMPFSPSWLKAPVLIFYPLWMLVRGVEYIFNIYVHEQEEKKEKLKKPFVIAMVDQEGRREDAYQLLVRSLRNSKD